MWLVLSLSGSRKLCGLSRKSYFRMFTGGQRGRSTWVSRAVMNALACLQLTRPTEQHFQDHPRDNPFFSSEKETFQYISAQQSYSMYYNIISMLPFIDSKMRLIITSRSSIQYSFIE